jgi:N-acetyl-gamma-glutamyl-phosphate reductase
MTVNLHVREPLALGEPLRIYRKRYAGEPLVAIDASPPWVSRIANRHGVEIGGFSQSGDGKRVVVVSTLDNLLKGAATQALQNVNLALGFPETTGLDV